MWVEIPEMPSRKDYFGSISFEENCTYLFFANGFERLGTLNGDSEGKMNGKASGTGINESESG